MTGVLQTVDSLHRVTPHMDDAARSLGLTPGRALRRVHLPLLRRGLLTAGLLVFIDVMKELPATLVMRPFNFDTLATQAYTLASDERLAEASTATITIVAVGLLPLIVLCRQIARERHYTSAPASAIGHAAPAVLPAGRWAGRPASSPSASSAAPDLMSDHRPFVVTQPK
jgi:ABC-type Fe3+ transport system permease subunit